MVCKCTYTGLWFSGAVISIMYTKDNVWRNKMNKIKRFFLNLKVWFFIDSYNKANILLINLPVTLEVCYCLVNLNKLLKTVQSVMLIISESSINSQQGNIPMVSVHNFHIPPSHFFSNVCIHVSYYNIWLPTHRPTDKNPCYQGRTPIY